MNTCTLSLFELYMVLFGLLVLSITALLPLSIYLWIAKGIPFYYGFIPVTTQIVLLCSSIKYLNFIRFLLYPFRWLAITQVLYFALHTACVKQMPNFYKDISSYDSLTNLYSIPSQIKLSKKERKSMNKTRNKMLKRVPKCINKLKDTQNLEIKTISANYLKRQHFKLLLEHATIMTIGKGKGQMAKYNQILELFLVIFFSVGIIDEFYVNGKLVAFQYGVVINDSYTAFQWYCNGEMRRSMLYFEGFRRDLKRCIAHPQIKYYNVMYTSSGDSGANNAKLECGMDQYLVDNEQNTAEILGNIYGYSLQKCCSCCICWVNLGGISKEYWDIKDESDEWNEEKELEIKQLEEDKKKQARERQKAKQKSGRRKIKSNNQIDPKMGENPAGISDTTECDGDTTSKPVAVTTDEHKEIEVNAVSLAESGDK